MITPDDKERISFLCALIAEEKDPGRFLLLVQELSALLENTPLRAEHVQPTTALRRAKLRIISHRA